MVLKHNLKLILLLLLALSFPFSTLAQIRVGPGDNDLFRQAKMAYKNGQYQAVISLLNRRFNLKDPKTPGGALSLAAYAYEKQGMWRNAEKLYAYLITKRYRTANTKIVRAYRKGDVEDAGEAPGKLYEYYHRRAECLTQLYEKNYYTMNEKLRGLYRKTALMYVAIIEEAEDYEDDTYDTIPERLENFEKEVKAKEYRTNWFLLSSYVSWRDKIKIRFSNGSAADLESTGEGTCLGGGWRYENDYYEFNINGCYAVASMTIGAQSFAANTPIDDYFQKGVASTAIMGGPSFLWKPKSKGAAFGINIPFLYRKGSYEPTPNAILDDTQIFTWGLLLQADWRFTKWGIFTKFGRVQRFSSSLWSLGAMYTF